MRQFQQQNHIFNTARKSDFALAKPFQLPAQQDYPRSNNRKKINFSFRHRVEIGEIFSGNTMNPIRIPFFESRVQAGFPAPTDEFSERTLDLNDYLLPHRATTFFVCATGDSMINVGIFSGDMLVVDRSLVPTYGSIVIAILNSEMTVKRLEKDQNRVLLCAENDEYPDITIQEEDSFAIWGVVTNVIHSLL